MAADPVAVDTEPATLRALHVHRKGTLVRDMTTPTPYGADGDEGESS